MTMREQIIHELRLESKHSEPMPVTTIRIPKDVHDEIVKFAEENDIRYAVVLRRAATIGWEKFKESL